MDTDPWLHGPDPWSTAARLPAGKESEDTCCRIIAAAVSANASRQQLAALGAALWRLEKEATPVTVENSEVRCRLDAIEPCIRAQVHAAAEGIPSRSSAPLVPREVQVMANAAKHLYPPGSFADITPGRARRAQRGLKHPASGHGFTLAVAEELELDTIYYTTDISEIMPDIGCTAVSSRASSTPTTTCRCRSPPLASMGSRDLLQESCDSIFNLFEDDVSATSVDAGSQTEMQLDNTAVVSDPTTLLHVATSMLGTELDCRGAIILSRLQAVRLASLAEVDLVIDPRPCAHFASCYSSPPAPAGTFSFRIGLVGEEL